MQETASRGCRSCRNPIDTNVSSWYAYRLDEFQSCNLLGFRHSNGGAKLSNGRRRAESERCHVRAKRTVRIRQKTFGYVGQGSHDVQVRLNRIEM